MGEYKAPPTFEDFIGEKIPVLHVLAPSDATLVEVECVLNADRLRIRHEHIEPLIETLQDVQAFLEANKGPKDSSQ